MRKFDLSLRSSRSSYFATFRHQLTILSKTDTLDEEKLLNMLGTFVKDWFIYESHFVHGRDSIVDLCLVLLLAVLLLLLLVAPCLNCLEAVKKPPPVAFKVMCLLPITIL